MLVLFRATTAKDVGFKAQLQQCNDIPRVKLNS